MAESASGNTAGEMNVKFTASAAPVKQAAEEAKQAIQEVATEGKKSGADIGKSMADAAAGVGEVAGGAANAASGLASISSLVSGMGGPLALLAGMRAIVDYIEESERKLVEMKNHLTDSVTDSLDSTQRLKDELRGIDQFEKEKQRLYAESQKIEADISKATAATNAKLAHDQIMEERERLRERLDLVDQIKEQYDAKQQDRNDEKYQEEADRAKQVWDKFIADKQKAEAKAEADRIEEMRCVEEAQIERSTRDLRERERELLDMARQRLQIEQQITSEREQQARGFGVGDTTFSSSAGLNAAIGQNEMARMWSD